MDPWWDPWCLRHAGNAKADSAGREPASQTAGRPSTNASAIAALSRANPMPSQHHARANKQLTTDQTEPLPQQDCTTETEDEGTFCS